MRSLRGSLLGVLLVLVPFMSFVRDFGAPALAGRWTTTDPPINFVHTEFGEINRRGEKPQPGGVGNAFSIAIAPDGAAIRNAVLEGAIPERYTLGELRAALETWIAAIERARRNPG